MLSQYAPRLLFVEQKGLQHSALEPLPDTLVVASPTESSETAPSGTEYDSGFHDSSSAGTYLR